MEDADPGSLVTTACSLNTMPYCCSGINNKLLTVVFSWSVGDSFSLYMPLYCLNYLPSASIALKNKKYLKNNLSKLE